MVGNEDFLCISTRFFLKKGQHSVDRVQFFPNFSKNFLNLIGAASIVELSQLVSILIIAVPLLVYSPTGIQGKEFVKFNTSLGIVEGLGCVGLEIGSAVRLYKASKPLLLKVSFKYDSTGLYQSLFPGSLQDEKHVQNLQCFRNLTPIFDTFTKSVLERLMNFQSARDKLLIQQETKHLFRRSPVNPAITMSSWPWLVAPAL